MTIQLDRLPVPSAPGGVYRPVVIHGGIAYVSGQLPRQQGEVRVMGLVGRDVDLETARFAARLCAMQCLAALGRELGGLERVVRLLRVTGYVASMPDFVQQPAVIDGASEFFMEALGARGEHARTAVSTAALPRGAAVEVELIAAIREGA
ncbi:MAG: RidA family protein [Xenophilus sp.]